MTPSLVGHFRMADTPQLNYRRETRTECKQWKLRPTISKLLNDFVATTGYSETDVAEEAVRKAASSLPLLEEVYCGAWAELPIEAVKDWVNPGDLLSVKKGDFLVPARGSSLTGGGIQEGDLIHFRPQTSCDNGDIAAVKVNTPTGTRISLRRVQFSEKSKKVKLYSLIQESEYIEVDTEQEKLEICAVKRGSIRPN